jgi:hypothetical protein
MSLLTEALAPTNFLLTNPNAMAKAAQTRGQSVVAGARNRAHDLRHNGGMPSQVDTRPFTVGGNLGITPGHVARAHREVRQAGCDGGFDEAAPRCEIGDVVLVDLRRDDATPPPNDTPNTWASGRPRVFRRWAAWTSSSGDGAAVTVVHAPWCPSRRPQ